jgi:dihydropteroate synthase
MSEDFAQQFAWQRTSTELIWQLPRRVIRFGRLPLIMGIVNVTPDSFFDGGKYLDPQAAIEHALRLEAEGADLLDIGGESTRPYASPVPAEEEFRRVIPVIARLAGQVKIPISVDTYKARVAEAAIAAGAEIVNDVTALRGDPEMLPLLARTRVGLCLMHMQGTPQTMQDAPHYHDVLAEVKSFLADVRDRAVAAGVSPEAIVLDPGIGFGKRLKHNLALLRNIDQFHALGRPILVGASRKRFIGDILGDPTADRLPGTLATMVYLATKGVHILRVHDVAAVRQALGVFAALQGLCDDSPTN